jgi:cytochrome c oxidase subunit 4
MIENNHAPSETTGAGHDDHGLAHVMPVRILVGVFLALMVLTVITVGVTAFDFGEFNLWVAIIIATVKACLVALYFMHLRYDSPFNSFIFVCALGFLGLFLIITMMDAVQYTPDVDAWREAFPAE